MALPDHQNITIAYPDEGSWKRFHLQLADYPEVGAGTGGEPYRVPNPFLIKKRPQASCSSVPRRVQIVCTKVRDGDRRIVRLKEGDAMGRHVVIVDDLVQSGGDDARIQLSARHTEKLGFAIAGGRAVACLSPCTLK